MKQPVLGLLSSWAVTQGALGQPTRASALASPAPEAPLPARGSLNNGPQTVSLTSPRDANSGGGWQLLGNPYSAPLDLSLIAAEDRAGLDAATCLYSSTSQYGGQYRAYVNGAGTSNPWCPWPRASSCA